MTRWQLIWLAVKILCRLLFRRDISSVLDIFAPRVEPVADAVEAVAVKAPRMAYDVIKSRLTHIGVLVLAFATYAAADGYFNVYDGLTKINKRISGGDGIDIANGIIRATGVPPGGVSDTTFRNYTSLDRPARSEVATAAQGAKADVLASSMIYPSGDTSGVTDLANIQTAINALPAAGGYVYLVSSGSFFLPAGSTGIQIGNGTNSANSTKHGIRLIGIGKGGTVNGTRGGVIINSAVGGPAIQVNGPVSGWEVDGIEINITSTSIAARGLKVISAQAGNVPYFACDISNSSQIAVEETTTTNTGAAGSNTMHNKWGHVHVWMSAAATNAVAWKSTGAAYPTFNTCNETVDNLEVYTNHATQTGVLLGAADTVSFRQFVVWNSGVASKGIVFDYGNGQSAGWPADCTFFSMDIGTSTITNSGTPTGATKNKIFGMGLTNGGTLPSLANLYVGDAPALADLADWPAAISATEVGYLDGVTSLIQNQLNSKPTNTGTPAVGDVPKYSDTTGTAIAPGYSVGFGANNLLQLNSDGNIFLKAANGTNTQFDLQARNSGGTIVSDWITAATVTPQYTIYDAINGHNVVALTPGAPDNSFFISSTGSVGLGTNSPAGTLDLNKSGASAQLTATVWGGGSPTFLGRASGGNQSTPAQTPSGATLFVINGQGWDDTPGWAAAGSVAIVGKSSQAFTTTARGGFLELQTTADGPPVGSRTTKVKVWGSGGVSVNTVTANHTDPGAGNLSVLNNVAAKTFTPTIQAAATDGATVTFDLAMGQHPSVTLGGNRTLAFTNPQVGASYRLTLKQDATGNRTVTWPSFCTFITQAGTRTTTGPTLHTAASTEDTIIIIPTSLTTADCYARGY